MARTSRSDERGIVAPGGTEDTQHDPGEAPDLRAMVPAVGGGEAEYFDPSDESIPEELVIPYMKLAQGLTAEVKNRQANIGDNISSLGVNFGQWFTFVPLWHSRQAMYFKDNKLICRSLDGKVGTEFGPCPTCSHNYLLWKEGTDGREPPDCSLMATFPALIYQSEKTGPAEFEGIVAVQFARSSFGAGQKIITMREQKSRSRGQPTPFYTDMWKVTSSPKRFDAGESNVYSVQWEATVPREVMDWCSRLAREWSKAAYAEPADPGLGGDATTAVADPLGDDANPF